jgi:hypothetical protein
MGREGREDLMAVTQKSHYSRLERVTYTLDRPDIERAIRAEIATVFKLPARGQWSFDWWENGEGDLIVEMTQQFEHAVDGDPASLESKEE